MTEEVLIMIRIVLGLLAVFFIANIIHAIMRVRTVNKENKLRMEKLYADRKRELAKMLANRSDVDRNLRRRE